MQLMQRALRYSGKITFRLYHLCYYLSGGSPLNRNSKEIIRFKKLQEFSIRFFIYQSIFHLSKKEMDKELIIVRALGSNEMISDSSQPLDRLGKSLAATFGCQYHPNILVKKRLTTPIKSLKPEKRREALDDVYHLHSDCIDLNNRKILIIDDVVTSGATACSIIRAILNVFPYAKISVFALAWTPTKSQQEIILEQENQGLRVGEPNSVYGNRHIVDEIDVDYEVGKTFISAYG